MTAKCDTLYLCPICGELLFKYASHWQCQNNHSFDVAKQGYVNLLPVQHKNSRSPGDAADMVAARDAFLSAGYYQSLQAALVDTVSPWQAQHLLDVGCGEGYYTLALAEATKQVTAFDIAKAAVQTVAKKARQQHLETVQCLVASAAQMPLADASVDVVTSIFSPIVPHELARVLKSTGKLVIAKPAEQHLWTLREQLFDEVMEHDSDKFISQLSASFVLQDKQHVTCDMALDNAAINHLLTMTPYAYKAKPDKRAAVEQLDSLSVTASFYIYVFEKCV